MGCSSSSAQVVDQEKRPGTKPEEANGSVVKNSFIAENGQTIEAQMQLPVQTDLPSDLHSLGLEEVTEPMLLALETQEELGSGVDLLSPQATLEVVEALPAVEEAAPVENTVTETVKVETLVDVTEDVPENVVAAQIEAPVSNEEASVVGVVPEAVPIASVVAEPEAKEAEEKTEVKSNVEVLNEETIAAATVPELPPLSPGKDQTAPALVNSETITAPAQSASQMTEAESEKAKKED
uniref:Uncharacterized protein n=1 Tax=Knipowitschia caucasica TaxID=637954 RepID=A0AAV2MAX5_KNICA